MVPALRSNSHPLVVDIDPVVEVPQPPPDAQVITLLEPQDNVARSREGITTLAYM
jgi:hypothetical protein